MKSQEEIRDSQQLGYKLQMSTDDLRAEVQRLAALLPKIVEKARETYDMGGPFEDWKYATDKDILAAIEIESKRKEIGDE